MQYTYNVHVHTHTHTRMHAFTNVCASIHQEKYAYMHASVHVCANTIKHIPQRLQSLPSHRHSNRTERKKERAKLDFLNRCTCT